MSKFLLLNFEDFGLNQDITKTIQSHTLFCICCLKRNVPHINLLTCSHSEFLTSFGIPELNPVNQVICYQCHNMLKKIKLFKLQVETSLKLLVSQQNNPKSSNQRLHNLMIQKVIDIAIPLETSLEIQTNPETTDKNDDSEFKFEIPIVNTCYLENSLPTKSITERKIKNIEEALRIIDGNKSNDCINLLATSLKTFATANLGNISDVLLSGGGKPSIDNELLKPEANITETSTRDIEEFSEVTQSDVASTEKANKSLTDLDKKGEALPVIVKVESIKAENVMDIPTETTDEQPVNEQQNPDRINLTTVKLTKEELMQERLDTAASDAYLSSPHRCDWCLLGFHYKENLEDHMKRKHTTKLGSITCEICLQVLYPPGSYNAHTFRHYTRLQCSVCTKRFELHKEAEAIAHYKKEHTTPIHYVCEQCPYNTRVILTQQQWQQDTQSTQARRYSNAERQRRYREKRKADKINACTTVTQYSDGPPMKVEPQDDEQTNTRRPLSNAERQRRYRKLLRERKQQQKQMEEINPITHTSSIHQPQNVDPDVLARKRYLNKVRQRRFRARQKFESPSTSSDQAQAESLKDKFKSHIKKHSRFSCKVCGASFDKIQKLKKHAELSQHSVPSSTKTRVKSTKNRIYRCRVCKMIFKEASSLQMHRLQAHATQSKRVSEQYECQQCGKKYKNKASFKLHLAGH